MNLATTLRLYAGGPGSGCRGENCGRPALKNLGAIPYHDGWVTKDGAFHKLHGTHAETAVALGLAKKESGAVNEALADGNVRVLHSGPMQGGHAAGIEVHKLDNDTRELVARIVERMGFPGKVMVDVHQPSQSAEFNGRQVHAWMTTGTVPRRSTVSMYHFSAMRQALRA